MPDTRRSWLAQENADTAAVRGREATILLIAFANPEAAAMLEGEIEDLPLSAADLEPLRSALLAALADGSDPTATAQARLGGDPLGELARLPQTRALSAIRPGGPVEQARALLAEMIARHRARTGARAEMGEASREIAEAEGEDWTHRVREAGSMPMTVDMTALKRTESPVERRVTALDRMRAEAEAGGYRRKKPRSPSSNR